MSKIRGKQADVRTVDAGELSAAEQDRLQGRRMRQSRAARLAKAQLREASAIVTNRSPARARWLCLHVHIGKEFAVETVLNNAGVENFLLRETVTVVKRGQSFEVERAMIPGYVLVRFIPDGMAVTGLLRQKFVFDLVRGLDGYRRVPDREVLVLKALSVGDVERMAVDKTFKDGDKAKIVMGPFASFECTVLAVKYARRASARLLVNAFGRQTEIASYPLAFLQRL